MAEFTLGQTGLKLPHVSAGDVVTVRLKPQPRLETDWMTGRSYVVDESKNAQHYRHTTIWRVVAVNGSSAVVEAASGWMVAKRKREVWAIDAHDWFDASELFAAMTEGEE